VKYVDRPIIVSQIHRYFWVVPPREQISVSDVDKVFVKEVIKEIDFQIIVESFKLHNILDDLMFTGPCIILIVE
jgi:hypothetical protein